MILVLAIEFMYLYENIFHEKKIDKKKSPFSHVLSSLSIASNNHKSDDAINILFFIYYNDSDIYDYSCN